MIGIRTHVPTCQKVTRSPPELPGRPAYSVFDQSNILNLYTIIATCKYVLLLFKEFWTTDFL